MFLPYLILVLITLVQGEVPSCSKFITEEVQEQERVHPETDIYVKGVMNATLVLPNLTKTKEWSVEIKLSRDIDDFKVGII